jgi:flagellar basal-body rod protein FlgB
MSSALNSFLGIHESALYMQARRAEVLASNLANADTPGYKARDIDFRQAMAAAAGDTDVEKLRLTNPAHMALNADTGGIDMLYRQPNQASLDGNTVESQVEMAAYNDNAMRYLASLRFINHELNLLRSAIKGQ